METYRTDWKNEHLWCEGYRIRVAIATFVENIIGITKISVHFHIHTIMNIPANPTGWGLPGGSGMNAAAWAFTTRFKCRCGDKFPGDPSRPEFWHD